MPVFKANFYHFCSKDMKYLCTFTIDIKLKTLKFKPVRGLWQWCSDPGAVLTFKIKRFPPPGVGNTGDSDTTCANEGGDFDSRNFQMSESSGSVCGVTLVIDIDWCITPKSFSIANENLPDHKYLETLPYVLQYKANHSIHSKILMFFLWFMSEWVILKWIMIE